MVEIGVWLHILLRKSKLKCLWPGPMMVIGVGQKHGVLGPSLPPILSVLPAMISFEKEEVGAECFQNGSTILWPG